MGALQTSWPFSLIFTGIQSHIAFSAATRSYTERLMDSIGYPIVGGCSSQRFSSIVIALGWLFLFFSLQLIALAIDEDMRVKGVQWPSCQSQNSCFWKQSSNLGLLVFILRSPACYQHGSTQRAWVVSALYTIMTCSWHSCWTVRVFVIPTF